MKEETAEYKLSTFRRGISYIVTNDFHLVNDAWKVNLIEGKCEEYHQLKLKEIRDKIDKKGFISTNYQSAYDLKRNKYEILEIIDSYLNP